MEFELDPAIENGSQRRLFGFTRRAPTIAFPDLCQHHGSNRRFRLKCHQTFNSSGESGLRKHGVDFADVSALFGRGDTVVYEDRRKDYGERRYVLLGRLGPTVRYVAYTLRGDVIRIISATGEQAGEAAA